MPLNPHGNPCCDIAELRARGSELLRHNITMRREVIVEQERAVEAALATLANSRKHLGHLEAALALTEGRRA